MDIFGNTHFSLQFNRKNANTRRKENIFLDYVCEMCGSRKYPYPHHGGNWKFRRGGGSKTQKIPEGRGVV